MQREIKVIANSQNKNEVYMSDATTLGELKAELINKGYIVEDMDIKEGKSRIDLKDELALLPSNFMYRGEPTNDLVIMITPQNTKIKSGMANRSELYSQIKEHRLQSDCYRLFGKNYTQCSNVELEEVISEYEDLYEDAYMDDVDDTQEETYNVQESGVPVETIRTVVNEEIDKREASSEFSVNSIAMCLLKIINFLENTHLVAPKTLNKWRKSIRKDYEPYTQDELNQMYH